MYRLYRRYADHTGFGIRGTGSLNEKEWREQLAPLGLITAQFNDLRKMAVAGAVKAASDIWCSRNAARSELQAIKLW